MTSKSAVLIIIPILAFGIAGYFYAASIQARNAELAAREETAKAAAKLAAEQANPFNAQNPLQNVTTNPFENNSFNPFK